MPKGRRRSTLTTHETGVGSLSLVTPGSTWPGWVSMASLHGSDGP